VLAPGRVIYAVVVGFEEASVLEDLTCRRCRRLDGIPALASIVRAPGGRQDGTSAAAVSASRTGRRYPSRDSQIWAALLAVVSSVGAELVLLLGPLWGRLRMRRLGAVPVTVVLRMVMLLFAAVPTGGRLGAMVRSVSAVSADLPWWQAALRLPASMLVPASNLPAWGAFVQVAVIAAAAQALIGWRRMLVVGVVANAAATAGARVMAWLGPHSPWVSAPMSRASLTPALPC